ncbi:MAG TPA: glycosyltransferase [Acidobacteriaceae bacterium]|jgi:glycosyltransferase involved in cell wall biosynthesis|nr:glycosyltransferase [Acidobacteriaceae bacterium]
MKSGYPLVSVLFITYKRVELLERSFRAFLENTDYPNLETVIADDGSGAEIQRRVRTLPADVFALAPKNQGLGANNNNGLRHCSGKYILMIQDDCICMGPRDYLMNTIQVMEANPQVGIVNYCGAPHQPDMSRALPGSDEPCYITPGPQADGKMQPFLYSDQPHVVSREALEHVGYYAELRDMEQCEQDYNQRWINQGRFQTAVFPAYYRKLFIHEGEEQSFRTTRFRHKVDFFLMPIAVFLKRHFHPLYRLGRQFVRIMVTVLERLRIVR